METEQQRLERAIISHLLNVTEPLQFQRNDRPDNDADSWVFCLSAPRLIDLENPSGTFLPFQYTSKTYLMRHPQSRENLLAQLNKELPLYTCWFVLRTHWSGDESPLNLVDGTKYYFQYDKEMNRVIPVWEDVWEGNRPDFYGGSIRDAKEWVRTCGDIIYRQPLNPFIKKGCCIND